MENNEQVVEWKEWVSQKYTLSVPETVQLTIKKAGKEYDLNKLIQLWEKKIKIIKKQ